MTRFLSTQNCSNRRKFAHSKENLLTKIKFAQSKNLLKKFAHRICSQHRKTAHNDHPCRLGWINTMAKCLASSKPEHDWRAPLNGLSRYGWNVLGRTFLWYYTGGQPLMVQSGISCTRRSDLDKRLHTLFSARGDNVALVDSRTDNPILITRWFLVTF
jgi:hypothetical protein